jgi:hypothetical protein
MYGKAYAIGRVAPVRERRDSGCAGRRVSSHLGSRKASPNRAVLSSEAVRMLQPSGANTALPDRVAAVASDFPSRVPQPRRPVTGGNRAARPAWRFCSLSRGGAALTVSRVGTCSGPLAQKAEQIRSQKLDGSELALVPAFFVRLIALANPPARGVTVTNNIISGQVLHLRWCITCCQRKAMPSHRFNSLHQLSRVQSRPEGNPTKRAEGFGVHSSRTPDFLTLNGPVALWVATRMTCQFFRSRPGAKSPRALAVHDRGS